MQRVIPAAGDICCDPDDLWADVLKATKNDDETLI